MDEEFYFNYITNINDTEDYKKHWYKKLKPEQVKKTIKNIDTEQQLPSSYYCDYAKIFFIGDQREIIYSYVSSICHGKFSYIKDNNFSEENELITYATDYLIRSTGIIKQLTYNYNNFIMETKHEIVIGVWIKILYDHILK